MTERYKSDPEYREYRCRHARIYQTGSPEKQNRPRLTEDERRKRAAAYAKQWRANNREHLSEWRRKRHQERWVSEPRYRVDMVFSSSVYQALRGKKNRRSWEKLVGYSLEELMSHLEAQFTDGMTWGNYGEWHIDHIIPRAWYSYDSADSPAFRECWALSNLRPLWALDNIRKGDRRTA